MPASGQGSRDAEMEQDEGLGELSWVSGDVSDDSRAADVHGSSDGRHRHLSPPGLHSTAQIFQQSELNKLINISRALPWACAGVPRLKLSTMGSEGARRSNKEIENPRNKDALLKTVPLQSFGGHGKGMPARSWRVYVQVCASAHFTELVQANAAAEMQ